MIKYLYLYLILIGISWCGDLKGKEDAVMNLGTPDFEGIKHVNDLGQPYWSARELGEKLGYKGNWRGFEKVIKKAMVACATDAIPITSTDQKLRDDQICDENLAVLTHYDVAREIKATVERIHQKDTKDLPRAFDLRKELEARRRATKKRITKEVQDSDSDQQTLF